MSDSNSQPDGLFTRQGWLIQLLRAGAAMEEAAQGKDGRTTRRLRAGARAAGELAVMGLAENGMYDEQSARDLIIGSTKEEQ